MTETRHGRRRALTPGSVRIVRSARNERVLDVLVRSIVPVVLALVAGGILLLALGINPLVFYRTIWRGGIEGGAWQDSAIRMAPFLLIAAGLTVIFRANIWNLGYNGQFLLAAAFVSGYGPTLVGDLPLWLAIVVLFLMAGAVGAIWTLIPALLKARYGTNEIITTLMMSFIAIDLASILIKGPFHDPTTPLPQTSVIPFEKMLPNIPGTRIHVGLLVAFAAILVVHYVLTRTAWGLRLRVHGRESAGRPPLRHRPAAADRRQLPRLAASSSASPPPPTSSASGATSAPAGTRPTATRSSRSSSSRG